MDWERTFALTSIFLTVLIVVGTYLLADVGGYALTDRFVVEKKMGNSPRVQSLAENVTQGCSDGWCRESEITRFIFRNISYRNTTELEELGEFERFPSPKEVLNGSVARCVGQAVIFVGMMRSLGYEAQLVQQPEHLCAAYSMGGTKRFWNCINRSIIYVY